MNKTEAWNHVDRITTIAFNHGKELGEFTSRVKLDMLKDSHLSNTNILEDIAQLFVEGLLTGSEIFSDNGRKLSIRINLKSTEDQIEKEDREELYKPDLRENNPNDPQLSPRKPKIVRKLKTRSPENAQERVTFITSKKRVVLKRTIAKEKNWYSYGLLFGDFK